MIQKHLLAITLAVGLSGVSAAVLGPRAVAQSAPLPKPGFHHIHMNSANPSAAIDTFVKWYPATTKATVGGFEGLKTENGVYMLFSKVNTPLGVQGPDRGASAPLTAFWHHVWSHKDARNLIKSMRAADPKFDQTTKVALYAGPDGQKIDFSSDTYPGNLTSSQVAEAKAKGLKPTNRGGYFNWYGPDGVIIETSDTPNAPESYRIVGMFQEQPYCALFWYRKHLNAVDPPAAAGGRGGGDAESAGAPPAPTSEANCRVARSDEVSWPSTYKNGHYRIPPPQRVIFGDVTLRWYINQENRPITTTRGQLMDHIALSVDNLDAWVAKLKGEKVKFLMEPYKFGSTRAAMIEGPSLEAIELVEGSALPTTQQ